jgi:hypothetical protein
MVTTFVRLVSLVGVASVLLATGVQAQGVDPCPAGAANASLAGRVRYVACLAGSAATGEALARSIALEVSTAPFGSTSGGFTFTFDASTRSWTRTASTFGPAFSERALTAGRRKISAGVNVLRRDYDSFAGQDMFKLQVASLRGGPDLPASDTFLDLGLRTETLAVFGHFGVTDRFDLGVAVPVVRIEMNGQSRASKPAGGEWPAEDLQAHSSGLSDVAIVGKYRFWNASDDTGQPTGGLALMGTVRVPSGDEESLLGLGITRTLASVVGSTTWGRVSPHVNAGYEFWSKGIDIPSNFLTDETVQAKDQILYSAGVEVEVHPLLTVNVDVMGRYLRGSGRIESHDFTYIGSGNEFGLTGASVLVASEGAGLHTLTFAPGFKFNLFGSALLSAHALITPGGDGLRDTITPVIGFDWAFSLPGGRP